MAVVPRPCRDARQRGELSSSTHEQRARALDGDADARGVRSAARGGGRAAPRSSPAWRRSRCAAARCSPCSSRPRRPGRPRAGHAQRGRDSSRAIAAPTTPARRSRRPCRSRRARPRPFPQRTRKASSTSGEDRFGADRARGPRRSRRRGGQARAGHARGAAPSQCGTSPCGGRAMPPIRTITHARSLTWKLGRGRRAERSWAGGARGAGRRRPRCRGDGRGGAPPSARATRTRSLPPIHASTTIPRWFCRERGPATVGPARRTRSPRSGSTPRRAVPPNSFEPTGAAAGLALLDGIAAVLPAEHHAGARMRRGRVRPGRVAKA